MELGMFIDIGYAVFLIFLNCQSEKSWAFL